MGKKKNIKKFLTVVEDFKGSMFTKVHVTDLEL